MNKIYLLLYLLMSLNSCWDSKSIISQTHFSFNQSHYYKDEIIILKIDNKVAIPPLFTFQWKNTNEKVIYELIQITSSSYVAIISELNQLPQGANKFNIYYKNHLLKTLRISIYQPIMTKETIRLTNSMFAIILANDEIKNSQKIQLAEILLSRSNDVKTWNFEGFFSEPFKNVNPYISSQFGVNRHFFHDGSYLYSQVHKGVDFGIPLGVPVLATASGRVVLSCNRIITGNSVVIEHLPGLFTLYYHLNELLVKKGEWVSQTQQLGTVGASGMVTAAHLHYELYFLGQYFRPSISNFLKKKFDD